uniref:Leucine-rich repeat extensin-like protein 2 n=1 Tax=Crassostrea virginica TaxID=6565 RepID=A0A8B8BZG8_CRAVI|nr:leucine-rich repeat extensin-like protein 2 [Crassostrea virginica]
MYAQPKPGRTSQQQARSQRPKFVPPPPFHPPPAGQFHPQQFHPPPAGKVHPQQFHPLPSGKVHPQQFHPPSAGKVHPQQFHPPVYVPMHHPQVFHPAPQSNQQHPPRYQFLPPPPPPPQRVPQAATGKKAPQNKPQIKGPPKNAPQAIPRQLVQLQPMFALPPQMPVALQQQPTSKQQPKVATLQQRFLPPPSMFYPHPNYYPVMHPVPQTPKAPTPTTTTTTTTTTTPEPELETEHKSGTHAPHRDCDYWFIDRGVYKWVPCQGPPPQLQAPLATAVPTPRQTNPPVPHIVQECDYWYIQSGVYKWYPCPTLSPLPTTQGLFDFLFMPQTTLPPLNLLPDVKPRPVKMNISYREIERGT